MIEDENYKELKTINPNDKTDSLIEDREEQKKLVHPYRNYQILIILMIIIMIILGKILFDKNKILNEYITTRKHLLKQNIRKIHEQRHLEKLRDRIDVNYKSIFHLDQDVNTDIIRNLDELSLLNEFLEKNEKEISYIVCYKATVDGVSFDAMFQFCKIFYPLIFLIETVDGYRFGAYLSKNLEMNFAYSIDEESFIFSFDTKKKYKIRNPECAFFICDKVNEGFPIIFGEKDISIGNNFLTTESSFTSYPVSYERDDEAQNDYLLNGGKKKFVIKELEIIVPFIH